MQVKLKRLSAFVLAVIISISYMNYSVHAEEIPLNEQTNEQTGENKTQELDKLTLPAEDSTETENTEKGEASESVESIPEDVGSVHGDIRRRGSGCIIRNITSGR